MKNFIFLGRESDLAKAEIQAVYGKDYQAVTSDVIRTNYDISVPEMGSVIKSSELLMTCSDNWQAEILENIDKFLTKSKSNIGVSVFNKKISARNVSKFAYSIKKKYKKQGYKIRTVPNKKPTLNSAKILNNQLHKEGNLELNIIFTEKEIYVTKTLQVQDIDEYNYIDKNKPHIDPINGMLPHKLAKTMINLASPKANSTILDPFCGSGTVLMEALLKNHHVVGSDINPEMVTHSQENLAWLKASKQLDTNFEVKQGDAVQAVFPPFDHLIAETYLGPPLKDLPAMDKFEETIQEINTLHLKFLKNLHPQLKPNQNIVLAVPCWREQKNNLIDLQVVDDLENIGYTTASFEAIDELVYFRPYQVVARRILVLRRK